MKIIDADSHYLDPDVFKYVSTRNQHKVPKFLFDDDRRLVRVDFENDPIPISFNSLPPFFHNEHAGISNLDARIKDFQKLSIDFQILNPQELAMRFSYLVEKDLAIDMAQSYNRRLLEICKKYPDKFTGPGLLALQDIDWCLEEIEWCKKVGINSVVVDNCWPDIHYLTGYPLVSSPRFEEICAACEKNDILLSIHHAMHQLTYKSIPQFKNYDLQYYYPGSHLISLVGLITSNILDRFSNLRVLLSEGGMNFISTAYNLLKLNNPNRNIDRYFYNNFYFTIETEQTDKLLNLIKKFGADRFLFATDYPHDDTGGANKFKDYRDLSNLKITEDEIECIAFKNAKKIFKLDSLQ